MSIPATGAVEKSTVAGPMLAPYRRGARTRPWWPLPCLPPRRSEGGPLCPGR